MLREERKAFFQYRPGLDYRRGGCKGEKAEHRENRATLGAGLVSVSGVLVLGVLTLEYPIKVKSVNRKKVNPKYSDAGYGVLLHHEIGKVNSKRRKHKSDTSCTGQS